MLKHGTGEAVPLAYLIYRVVRALKGAATPMEVAAWPMWWIYRILEYERLEGQAEEYHAWRAANRGGGVIN